VAARRSIRVGAAVALLLLWLAMLVGGTGPVDQSLLHALYSADDPPVRAAALAITLLGQWQVLLPLALIGTLWLVYRKRLRSALLLVTIALVGRALVELQKWGIARLRPDDRVHLVPVKSLSYPSAHAANSMILFLCLALLVAPERHRKAAIVAALAGAMLVGFTRPMLGVHWPSDVIGGWAFGALWVLAVLWLSGRAGFHAREGRAR
jgi:membrane-associated phospholipid phosphatase